MNKLFGYARVSTEAQNLQSQLDLLKTYGVEDENIYADIDSGAKTDRKQLSFLMKLLRPGDTVVFHDISRIGRDFKHLLDVIEFFHKTEVQFKDLTNPMIDTNSTRTPEGELIFSVFGLMAQFFRKSSNEKVRKGLEAAKRRGKVGGRPSGPTQRLKEIAPHAVVMHKNPDTSISDIRKAFKISQGSVYTCFEIENYDYKKQHKNKGNKNAAYKLNTKKKAA